MSKYIPSKYKMRTTGKGKYGLIYQPPAKKDEDGNFNPVSPVWICDPFEVTARSRDIDSANHGLVLEWEDPDCILHTWVMPFDLLAGDGVEIRKVLLNGGLRISTQKSAKEHLLSYLNESMPKRTARSVFTIGWHSDVYIMPTGSIGGI